MSIDEKQPIFFQPLSLRSILLFNQIVCYIMTGPTLGDKSITFC